MKKTILLLGLLLFTVIVVGQKRKPSEGNVKKQAKKMKVSEGNIQNLKGITQFDLVFDYSDVQIPKYDSEEAFLNEKMARKDEKSNGTGEIFKKNWFDDREGKYQPKFIEGFNSDLKMVKLVLLQIVR